MFLFCALDLLNIHQLIFQNDILHQYLLNHIYNLRNSQSYESIDFIFDGQIRQFLD